MTWEELVEKAKKLDYSLKEMDFGQVETSTGILAENRTYDQMYQIILALREG